MASYKEIVTKAVIGKGKKNSTAKYTVICDQHPDTVLGCWIINHEFSGNNRGNQVSINGGFDVNVWYSYDNDTKTAVSNKRFTYDDLMNVKLKENTELGSNPEIIVRSLKQPTVTDVIIENGRVVMNVEKEFGIEIVGDAKMKIMIEDDEDDYDIIEDEPMNEQVLEKIDSQISEDYIN